MGVDWQTFWPRIVEATGQTILMVAVTLVIGSIFGIIIGLLLFVTRKGNILENAFLYQIINFLINIIRPIPFIIFLVAISPLTREVIGTTIGTWAAIFPMSIAAAFSIARVVENNFISIDPGVIEAAKAMGASPLQIIYTILIPEALGPLVLGLTFITISLIDFSAMAGTVGGGGLGHVAMTYGYQRFDTSVMIVTVVILIVLVQLAQWVGNTLSRKILRR
ncbi:methionine ABC transporter permease [Terribacillus saccharophilus]|jgi:D-methionine transport system permease protein|uniref:ABC transporter permease n=1 Tax=Terribacillus saccharophilus TaxID=361277 RepID=A0A268ADU2_9BACI|nr:methionine ABC transporter permease [Terribacillus saccharophilus]PAD22288.1 ABC transporter permease [Terribacillus saccharophilus]PAD34319.1 ABC transporter permease [Terribacillus saccharophilus]PAD94897.1 ABC transporter permease [Terribacillus saccharophilus]PAD98646.1 ABC transporter permease [Terribacillus saccharophilus]PAE08383.1 ABC transporter permease [Terribacillus saccharophilus]